MAAGPVHAADFDDAGDDRSALASTEATRRDGAAMSSARNDQEIFENSSETCSIHGSAVSPSNTTGVNGDNPSLPGGTGCTFAGIFTDTVLLDRFASGSASSTSTCHNNFPVSESTCCTLRSLVDFSKSTTGATSETRYAPNGNASSNGIGNLREIAMPPPFSTG